MKSALAIAAATLALGIASNTAQAQTYYVNGHTASPTEVQHLVARGMQPGHWVVNGFGISAVSSTPAIARPRDSTCWYVLDEKLCD